MWRSSLQCVTVCDVIRYRNLEQIVYTSYQCRALCCSMFRCIVVCCNVVQCVAVCYCWGRHPISQFRAGCVYVISVPYTVLQCLAVYCSVLQCGAVCCSVLQLKRSSDIAI